MDTEVEDVVKRTVNNPDNFTSPKSSLIQAIDLHSLEVAIRADEKAESALKLSKQLRTDIKDMRSENTVQHNNNLQALTRLEEKIDGFKDLYSSRQFKISVGVITLLLTILGWIVWRGLPWV